MNELNKIKLTGVKNIPFLGEIPQDNGEYLITLIASPSGVFTPTSQGEEELPITYTLKVDRYESVNRIGEKKLDIGIGFSKSQLLRFALKRMFNRGGIDDIEENYEKWIEKFIKVVDNKYN